jgi:hypothetical protein
MTVGTNTRKTIQAGNGINTNWNFAFAVRSAADLQVYLTDAQGVQTLLAANLYSVVLNPIPGGQLWAQGGTVTYPLTGTPVPAGASVTVARNVPFTQTSSLINQGGYSPQTTEQALDLLAMGMQQINETIGRAVTIPISSTASTALPLPLANALLGWDPTATFITNVIAAGAIPLPLPVASGGTGGITAAAARTNLGSSALGDSLFTTAYLAAIGTIAPAQLVANTNDWNPAGLATASVIRFSTDASRNVTGLQGGSENRFIALHNIGAQPAVLKREDAASAAANRFKIDADITLLGDQSIILMYDATTARWRHVEYSNGEFRSVQIFAASGTYTAPAGLKRAKVTVVGGGGAGGGCVATAGGQCSVGGGAGAGGVAIKTVSAATIGVSQVVTVGAGGVGANGAVGTSGGTSSFGAIATATGGSFGAVGVNAASSGAQGGLGGLGASGDLNTRGGPGGFGFGTNTLSDNGGVGGSNAFGGGAQPSTANTNGTAGGPYGGGGSGAANDVGRAAGTGGNGADGVVFVEEFF